MRWLERLWGSSAGANVGSDARAYRVAGPSSPRFRDQCARLAFLGDGFSDGGGDVGDGARVWIAVKDLLAKCYRSLIYRHGRLLRRMLASGGHSIRWIA